MSRPVTFDRPVKAALIVRLDNGEEWEATDDDLAKFHLVRPGAITRRYMDWCIEHLGTDDLTDTNVNPLRYVFECAIGNYGFMPNAETAEDLKATIALGLPSPSPTGGSTETADRQPHSTAHPQPDH